MSTQVEKRETWNSSTGFILAAIGSAVGLGNIWKFPYIAGDNGGGAFVIVYMLCLAFLGLPLMIGEMTMGRLGKKGLMGTYTTLAPKSRGGKYWGIFAAIIIVSTFILLSFYSVIGGWTIGYLFKTIAGTLAGDGKQTAGQVFETFIENPVQSTIYHTLFMVICTGVVIGGISKGIERAAFILMPLLMLLLLVLFGYSLTTPGANEALSFMFSPDFSKLTPASILEAMGHSFFTLSLGMGVMIVYGSYLKSKDSIFMAAGTVALADTAIALIAGVTIFGIVFSAGIEPGQGPGLIFVTLPSLFTSLPFGTVWALLFFLLLAFAAITSGISIMEVTVSYFVDEKGFSRTKSSLIIGATIFAFGMLSVLSFNVLSDVTLLTLHGTGGEPKPLSIFDTFDYLVSNWALTIGGLGVALFVGWGIPREDIWNELKDDILGKTGFTIWLMTTRFVAPVAVIIVLLHSIGMFGD